MNSHLILELFWFTYSLLLGGLAVITVICFRKDRSGPTLVMLLSAIVGAVLTIVVQSGFLIGNRLRWFSEPDSNVSNVLQITGFVASACTLLFHVGLLIFALRWRRQADRIAELEAIIQDLQQEKHRGGSAPQ